METWRNRGWGAHTASCREALQSSSLSMQLVSYVKEWENTLPKRSSKESDAKVRTDQFPTSARVQVQPLPPRAIDCSGAVPGGIVL